MDNNKQSSAISDQSSDQTDKSVTQAGESETTQSEETAPEETAKSEETPSSVIASEVTPQADEAKQSNQDQDSTQIATSPMAPRNDEKVNETEVVMDKSADEPTSTDKGTPDLSKKDNPNAKWYVVHTYSGHENKVAHTLKQRVESEHLEEKILDVLVPMQDKIEIKGGKKINVKEKIFPGYILVKMVLDDVSWLAVRTTQGVTSFVGMSNKPTPIS
ncbi:MAG: transcription termination/antitermination NusG family protein, partial [Patescibacteria group bacterium]